MNNTEIIEYLKSTVDPFLGMGYRAAAYLKDGIYLPAVIFRKPEQKSKSSNHKI